MGVRRVILWGLAAGLCCAAVGAVDARGGERVTWGCAKCHETARPAWGMKPTAAKLNSLSFYGEWEDSKRQTAKIAKYTYVSAYQIVEAQYAVAYPDDPDRKDYVYLFNPATQSYWARCDALRPAEKQAEWSFRIEGKWSEEKRTDVRIPGTGRAVIEPPPPPI